MFGAPPFAKEPPQSADTLWTSQKQSRASAVAKMVKFTNLGGY